MARPLTKTDSDEVRYERASRVNARSTKLANSRLPACALVQGCREVLSDDAVRKAKLVKGSGGFRRQTIFQALLEKLQTIDQVSGAIWGEGFDEFRHSAYNKRSVICQRPFADVDDMVNLELPSAVAPYHLSFSLTDDI